ncbi:MAG: hypothetical protein Pg6A_00470 [Termitinemataceae bacterium]|jgi:hypothetical protein|nr:MAG: hypothetical protein Pg6A_00470 [Termitinemataceae bacterium]
MARRYEIIIFLILFLGLNTAVVFGAPPKTVGKYSDISDALDDFSKANAGRVNTTAGIGLNWSDAYIGELISYPPHYGFGFTFGVNSLKTSAFNPLIEETLGLSKIDPVFVDKHFFPTYLIEMRLGGFRDIPFDFGVKFGWMPALSAMPTMGDLKYNNIHAGMDLRFNILSVWTGFQLSWGLGLNYMNGYLQTDSYTQTWSDDGLGGGTNVFDPAGSKMRLTWDTFTIDAKIIFQKSWRMLGITFFGGIVVGYGIGHTGITFIGEDWTWDGNNVFNGSPAQYQQVEDGMAEKMGNNSVWNIERLAEQDNPFAISGKIATNTIDFHTYEGISFDFDSDWHVQVALIFDLANFEYGFMVGVRWQQKQY